MEEKAAREGFEEIKPGEVRVSHADVGGPLADVMSGDFGDHLPHGFVRGAGHLTAYRLNRPVAGIRRAIGSFVTRKDLQGRPGTLFCYSLAVALRELDGEAFTNLGRAGLVHGSDGRAKVADLALKISRLCVGDVLRLVVAYQATHAPDGLVISGGHCEKCRREIGRVQVQLGDSVPLRAFRPSVTSERPARAWVGLYNPVELQDGRIVHAVELAAPTWWSVFWSATQEDFSNPAALLVSQVVGSVVGTDVPGVDTLTPADVEMFFEPRDCELIDDALEAICPTPIFGVQVACPHCEAANQVDINWLDPGFFRRASAG